MAQKKKSTLWLAWGLLLITDLSFRGTSWLAHNVSGLLFHPMATGLLTTPLLKKKNSWFPRPIFFPPCYSSWA